HGAPAAARPATTTSGRALVVARFVAAEDDLAFLLGLLLEQVRATAVRARFGQRTVVGGEAALGVAAAPVEHAAPAALALDHLALSALGADEPDLPRFLLLDVLAIGVVAAGDEGTEAAAAPHQRLAALGAVLVDRLERLH